MEDIPFKLVSFVLYRVNTYLLVYDIQWTQTAAAAHITKPVYMQMTSGYSYKTHASLQEVFILMKKYSYNFT